MMMKNQHRVPFRVGPEDIGKEVFVFSVSKKGIVTSWTSEYVSVLSASDRRGQRYRYDDLMYLTSSIRH